MEHVFNQQLPCRMTYSVFHANIGFERNDTVLVFLGMIDLLGLL